MVIEEENRREAEIKNFALPLHDLNEKELVDFFIFYNNKAMVKS